MSPRRFLPLALLLLGAASAVDACTGIQLKTKDGAVVMARTLEFGADLKSDFIVIPRGLAYVGSAPGGKPGLKWTTKFGAAGAAAMGMPQLVDGVNEKGLGVGLFYLPGCVGYQDVLGGMADRALAPWELGTYLLTTCGSAAEAVAAAKAIFVGPTVLEAWKFVPPVHYVVHDATGACFVLEYVGGKLTVHANPLGVLTNSPTFDWHVTNLRNYVNLSADNAPPVELGKVKLAQFGQGSGMVGLPGDFTPPARFVRAVAFTQSALPVASADEGVAQAFHLLNQFDLPKGALREKLGGQLECDYTQWTSAADLTNRRYHFRTYGDQTIRRIDLKKCDLDAKEVKRFACAGKEAIVDLTAKAN